MVVLSKVALDARSGAESAAGVAVGAEIQLRHAAQLTAAQAQAWAAAKPQDGLLTAILDLPDAARLNVAAWLEALQPDTVELRVPAWSEAGMAAIGWPAGHAALQQVLKTLTERQVATRLALHVSALTLAELSVDVLNELAQTAGLEVLTLVLRPVLGDAAPRLDGLAQAAVLLSQTGHSVTASRLLPACAMPEGFDGEASYPSERAAAKQDFTAECDGCPAREEGRCDGIAADLLRATSAAGRVWSGWATLAKDRAPTVVPSEQLPE